METLSFTQHCDYAILCELQISIYFSRDSITFYFFIRILLGSNKIKSSRRIVKTKISINSRKSHP